MMDTMTLVENESNGWFIYAKKHESIKDNINGFIGNIMHATEDIHSPNKKVKVHTNPDIKYRYIPFQ